MRESTPWLSHVNVSGKTKVCLNVWNHASGREQEVKTLMLAGPQVLQTTFKHRGRLETLI